jgi:hypothetical protein
MAKRGRKAKQRDIEEAIDETQAPPAGHNGSPELTDDEQRALFFQHKKNYQRDLAAKKAADAALKNTCKKAKAECGDNAVANIKDAIEFEGADGRAKYACRARDARVSPMARRLSGREIPYSSIVGGGLTLLDEKGRAAFIVNFIGTTEGITKEETQALTRQFLWYLDKIGGLEVPERAR